MSATYSLFTISIIHWYLCGAHNLLMELGHQKGKCGKHPRVKVCSLSLLLTSVGQRHRSFYSGSPAIHPFCGILCSRGDMPPFCCRALADVVLASLQTWLKLAPCMRVCMQSPLKLSESYESGLMYLLGSCLSIIIKKELLLLLLFHISWASEISIPHSGNSRAL